MSLQVVYSFDHVLTANLSALPRVIQVSSNTTISTTGGRDGGHGMVTTDTALVSGGGLSVAVDPYEDVTAGMWIVFPSLPTFPFLQSLAFFTFSNPLATDLETPDTHVCLVAQSDGSIAAYRSNPTPDGVLLGSTDSGVITAGTAYYLEARAVIGASGSVTIRINGVTVLNATGVNTQLGTSSEITFVKFGAISGVSVRYDDIYVVTGQDTEDGWTGFAGIIKVHGKIVNAIGDYNEWTPSSPSGVNWQNVDETTPNESDYNDAASVGLIDTYNIEDISFDPIAVQTDLYMKKLDDGSSSVAHVMRTDGENFISSESQTLSTTYKYYRKVYTTVPTGDLWTETIFNAIQAGPEKAV